MKYFFTLSLNSENKNLSLKEIINYLNLPYDIFRINKDSYGTVLLSKEFNFKFLGFGKYLGETWGYIFNNL